MINTEDQEALFKLVANYLEKDVSCVAIGGTAMMFLGYKNTTKDIDLVFETKDQRNIFVTAIQELGYMKRSLASVYDEKRKKHKGKPEMFTRGDERFDLFVKDVFGYEITFTDDRVVQRNDFLGKNELTIRILDKNQLVLLKAITRREADYEDIERILSVEKNLDWDYIVQEAIKQKERNEWMLIDLEETMQKLKSKFFIPSKFFDKIYASQK